jgi:hypothetical protein
MSILRKFSRDNPTSNRLIEHGTKALERKLMSGETLRAPRQQLRPLRASVLRSFFHHPKRSVLPPIVNFRRLTAPVSSCLHIPCASLVKSTAVVGKVLAIWLEA